jgi:hypothetical protein
MAIRGSPFDQRAPGDFGTDRDRFHDAFEPRRSRRSRSHAAAQGAFPWIATPLTAPVRDDGAGQSNSARVGVT